MLVSEACKGAMSREVMPLHVSWAPPENLVYLAMFYNAM